MKYAKGSYLAAAMLLAVVSLTTAAVYVPPTLYNESPNARAEVPKGRIDLDYRLPNNTEPISYDIELTTNVHTGEKAFTGTVKIELMTTEATNFIVLHARQIAGFQVSIRPRDNPQSAPIPMSWNWEEEREFLLLTPTDETIVMPKDTYWILTISYSGSLREDNEGFYISSYTGEDGQTHYLATTQFEATDARHAFPCYDEPAKRAVFTITINHSPTYSAISNMPVDTAKSSAGRTVFQPTLKMPSYIIAFIVSDFKYSEGTLNGLPQRIYSRPGTENEQEFALISGMLFTERLGEYYNIRYPLPKIDQAAIPDFSSGAMENWGLATYREEYLLYNKEKSTTNTQSNVANVEAHELTHMWFGDFVTVRWWTYTWLKEGFATLYSYYASDETYPEWGVWQTFHTDEYQRALVSDGFPNPRPMTHYVQTPREIDQTFDYVSYSKAGCVLSMFQHALTDEVFRLGLNKYLTLRGFDSGVEEDLFFSIQTAAKELNKPIEAEIQAMMGSWTRHGGYPVLNVTRNYTDGSFKVTQEQFFNNEALSTDYTWYVPFNYIDATNWDFRDTAATHFLRKEKEITVPAKVNEDDWLILNKQSTGYYRINYDNENWNKIIDGLWHMPNRIHPRNRAQLMHDAYYFATSKRLDYNTLLSMMLYLPKEEEYAPWSTANGVLVTLNRYLSGDKNYEDFQQFTAELVTDIYNKLGVNDMPGEQHFQKYTRNIAINLACLAGIEACLQDTNNKLKDSISKNIEVEPNLQASTYCNGLRRANTAEYDHVYNKLMDSQEVTQRRSLISALGCAQDESQLKKFVESSIDRSNKLRNEDRATLLNAAYSRGEVGLMASIDFLDKNWEEYSKLTPAYGSMNPLQFDLIGMSSYCVTEEQKTKLKALVDKVKDSPQLTSSLAPTVDSNINNNMKWIEQNRDPLIDGIRNLRNSSASLTASIFTIALAFFVTMSRYL